MTGERRPCFCSVKVTDMSECSYVAQYAMIRNSIPDYWLPKHLSNDLLQNSVDADPYMCPSRLDPHIIGAEGEF